MSGKVRILTIGLLPLLLGGLTSCNPLTFAQNNLSVTQVNQLQQQQSGSTVYLEGLVGDRAPFLDNGAYQLQDDTGTVWVFTDENLPAEGDQVSIKGEVEYQTIPVQGQELGELYIIELEQLEGRVSSPVEPTPTVEPTELAKPAKPVESTEPVEPTETAKPTEPTELPKPIKPAKPARDLFLPHKRLQPAQSSKTEDDN